MSLRWKALLTVLVVFGTCAMLQAANPATRSLSSTDTPLVTRPSHTPPPPDPNVILQGGDTCATATAIAALPYDDSGTTAGYTNDYDEVCPYSGSTSPDVVYSYAPAADTWVDITLCTGTTAYDTKLYVYEDTCPTTYTACNDDSCSSPSYSNYVSSLSAVALTGGHTYYIVVDGYGGNSGAYSIHVEEVPPPPPPPACDMADVLYGQVPHTPTDAWSAATSGQTTSFDYTVADNFDGATMRIEDLHWWGLALVYNAGWTGCPTPQDMTFDVRFYDDAGGQPGTEICSYAGISPPMVNTTLLYASYSLYYWQLTGISPACQPTGAAWVSVKSLNNAGDCTFLWMSGTGGDGDSLQLNAGVWGATGFDRGMCITGTVPVELQSFTAK